MPAPRAAALPLLAALLAASCAPRAAALAVPCESGDADACEQLAACYFLGEGVPRDEAAGATLTRRTATLRGAACIGGDAAACAKNEARWGGGMIVSKPMPAAAAALDLPKAAGKGDAQLVFNVDLHVNGDLFVSGNKLANDDALFAVAKAELEKNPDLRAVIRADTAVTHGRVVRVLDLLKQAGISKIAFGVAPVAPSP
jgi:biopolymer transport protein ExbD